MERRIGTASAVMRTLRRSVVVKRQLREKAKLSIYWSIFAPTLTNGHELWVVTKRTRSRVQATAEISFLRRLAGLSLRDRVRSSAIREQLGEEHLCLHREEPNEVVRARPISRRPPRRTRTPWRDHVSAWPENTLGYPLGRGKSGLPCLGRCALTWPRMSNIFCSSYPYFLERKQHSRCGRFSKPP